MSILNPIERCSISPSLLEKIADHAKSQPTAEVCGLILGNELFYPCSNTAIDPENYSIIDAQEIAKASLIAPITHHYHSHVDSPEFSAIDIQTCRGQLSVPWILYHTPSGVWDYYDPEYKAPLIGRNWRWAYQNCFNLFQDYFALLGVEIDDFYLESPEAWKQNKSVGYVENLEGQGFFQIPDTWPIEKHDVLLIWAGRSPLPCHVGMVVDPASNTMIHHLAGQLSKYQVFDRNDKSVHSVWRYSRQIYKTEA